MDNQAEVKKKERANLIQDFLVFIKRYGVVGLALGVVIGGAVNNLVDSLVNNIINPILAKIISEGTLSEFTVFGLRVGLFISDIINFFIIMAVAYLSIRFMIRKIMTKEELEKFK